MTSITTEQLLAVEEFARMIRQGMKNILRGGIFSGVAEILDNYIEEMLDNFKDKWELECQLREVSHGKN